MKVSIITVTYNSEKYIEHAIRSVQEQDYPNIEHIIIDGASSDNTLTVINKYIKKGKNQNNSSTSPPINPSTPKSIHLISEPDNGIYHAMNKGIKMANGDIIGTLNSDDYYANQDVISKVVKAIENEDIDAVIGDIIFVSPENENKIVRSYSAKKWHPGRFAWGYMPPHPSFFVKRHLFEQLGYYKEDYQIAADYELLIRYLFVHNVPYKYIQETMVKMRTGGASTRNWKSNVILNEEIIRGCRENGVSTNRLKVYSKYFKKVFELINV